MPGTHAPMTRKQRTILAITMIAGFMAPFMSTALSLAITDISAELDCGATTATWVINAYTLCTAACSMPFGHLADVKGRKPFLLMGTAMFFAFCVLSVLATNVYVLIAARAGMSIGASAFLAATIPMAITCFPPHEKGRALGIAVIATYLGIALGPVIGGIITKYLGWRWIFVTGIVCAPVAFVMGAVFADDDRAEHSAPLDHLGNVYFIVALALLMFGLSEAGSLWWARVALAAGFAVLVVFVVHEAHTDDPIVQVKLYVSNPAYGLSNLACLLSFGASFGITYSMAIYLENVLGLDTSFAGLLLVATPLLQILFSPYAGRLSDRIASYKVATAGMAIITASLVILSFLTPAMPLWLAVAALAVLGLGNAFFGTPNNNAILSCVDRSRYSEASSSINTMRGIGQSLSVAMVSLVFALTIGNTVFVHTDPAQLADAIRIIMVLSLAVSVLATVISFISGKRGEGD